MYSTVYKEKWTSLNLSIFHLPKNGAADPKKSAPAPAKILNRLRLQPKNLGSDQLRNTDFRAKACDGDGLMAIFIVTPVFWLESSQKIIFQHISDACLLHRHALGKAL